MRVDWLSLLYPAFLLVDYYYTYLLALDCLYKSLKGAKWSFLTCTLSSLGRCAEVLPSDLKSEWALLLLGLNAYWIRGDPAQDDRGLRTGKGTEYLGPLCERQGEVATL